MFRRLLLLCVLAPVSSGAQVLGHLLDDTWVWDGTHWTEKYPATRPQWLWDASTRQPAQPANDTWLWTGTDRVQTAKIHSPWWSSRNLFGLPWTHRKVL
jgi:hypothetical protein